MAVETGFAEASKAIFEIALQIVGGLFTGMIDAYISYLRTGTGSKVGSIAGLAFATLVLFMWHKSMKEKGSSGAWAVEVILTVTRIFLTFSVVGMFMKESISKPFFYSLFTAIIVLNIGLGRIVGGWVKSAQDRAQIFGNIEKAPWETIKNDVDPVVKPIVEKIKKNAEEKTEQERINLLAGAVAALDEAIVSADKGMDHLRKKREISNKLNTDGILTRMTSKLDQIPMQKQKVSEILTEFEEQRKILSTCLESERIAEFTAITDKKKQKDFISTLPKNSRLYKNLKKEILEEDNIISFLGKIATHMKSIRDTIGKSNNDFDAPTALLLNSVTLVKGDLDKNKAIGRATTLDLIPHIFKQWDKEHQDWIALKKEFESQRKKMHDALLEYEATLKNIGLAA